MMKRIGIFLTVGLLACGGSDATPGAGGGGQGGGIGGGEPVDACPALGATECVGTSVRTCTQAADGLAWSEPEVCPGEQTCKGDSCQDPTAMASMQSQDVTRICDNACSQALIANYDVCMKDPTDGVDTMELASLEPIVSGCRDVASGAGH